MNSVGDIERFQDGNIIKFKDENGYVTEAREVETSLNGGMFFTSSSNIYNLIINPKSQFLKVAVYDRYEKHLTTFSTWTFQPKWR